MLAACVVLASTICVACCATFYNTDYKLPTYLVSSTTLAISLCIYWACSSTFLNYLHTIYMMFSLVLILMWVLKKVPVIVVVQIQLSSSMQDSNKKKKSDQIQFITLMKNCKQQFYQKYECNA